jgi:hypothetical protein
MFWNVTLYVIFAFLLFLSDHLDPEAGDALVQYLGHVPTGARYEQPDFEYTGRDAIAVITNSTVARVRLTRPSQCFFGMFQGGVIKPTPYGQIDASHLFADLPFDTLQVSISGLAHCYGHNILTTRQIEVSFVKCHVSFAWAQSCMVGGVLFIISI